MRKIALLIVPWLFTACVGTEPCPPDRFDPIGLNRPIPVKVLAEAPIAIVARVTGVRALGPRRRATRLPEVVMECTRITAEVENVLKGDVPGASASFYYYVYSKYNTRNLGARTYLPVLGQRHIFFLTRDAGVLRSIGDVRDYTLHVASGRHDSASLRSLPFGEQVATILLTPGQGYDGEYFAKEVVHGEYVSDELVSPEYTTRLLEALAKGEDPRVRCAAQEELAGYPERQPQLPPQPRAGRGQARRR